MKLFGLTGGVGMGKSTCADMLRRRGIAILDTDDLARELVQPGQPALNEIVQCFGSEVLDASGRLQRSLLADLVFADPAARQRLETILHPRIRSAWQNEVERWRETGIPVGVVVIPLLFETHAGSHFDATVCVACTRLTQEERLSRRGWTSEEMVRRAAAQMPVEQKIAMSTFVIWSEGSLAALSAQAERVVRQ